MAKQSGLKIDLFPHVIPVKYKDALLKVLPGDSYWTTAIPSRPALYDMDARFRIMDKYEGLVQVLTTSSPPIELVFKPKKAAELAKIANDSMAELVVKYPDRFVGAVACLPMNDMDATLKEVDRTIKELKFCGIQVHTPVVDKPMDAPEFLPLYEKMEKYDLPIWIHPYREESWADYKSETRSKFRIYHRFGWPYETTAAMARLVYSGVLERYPNLKFITHHCGAMIPFLASRAEPRPDIPVATVEEVYEKLTCSPLAYFKKFYADTANILVPGLMCGYQFFGASHILFGTDMPYGVIDSFIRMAVDGVQQMEIPETDKKKIFADNARKLLRLSV